MPAALAPLLDVAVVIVFAAIGRRNHGESGALEGIAMTAWPFLAGALVGWALVLLRGRRLLAGVSLPSGAVVWLSVIGMGMLGRHLDGRGTAPAFVVVALVFNGVFLLGWRAARLVAARREQA